MTDYVTVFPDEKGRSGWQVARRNGSLVTKLRLEAPIAKREEAREEAQRMYPDLKVWVMGDKDKPWA